MISNLCATGLQIFESFLGVGFEHLETRPVACYATLFCENISVCTYREPSLEQNTTIMATSSQRKWIILMNFINSKEKEKLPKTLYCAQGENKNSIVSR